MSSEQTIRAAEVLADAQQLAERLQSALETRAVIDQAIGVTMSQSGGTQAEALDRLRGLSQTQHQQLAMIARGIVERAVGFGADLRPMMTTTSDNASEELNGGGAEYQRRFPTPGQYDAVLELQAEGPTPWDIDRRLTEPLGTSPRESQPS